MGDILLIYEYIIQIGISKNTLIIHFKSYLFEIRYLIHIWYLAISIRNADIEISFIQVVDMLIYSINEFFRS